MPRKNSPSNLSLFGDDPVGRVLALLKTAGTTDMHSTCIEIPWRNGGGHTSYRVTAAVRSELLDLLKDMTPADIAARFGAEHSHTERIE